MTKLVARPPFFLYPFIKCNRSRPPDLMWKEKLYKILVSRFLSEICLRTKELFPSLFVWELLNVATKKNIVSYLHPRIVTPSLFSTSLCESYFGPWRWNKNLLNATVDDVVELPNVTCVFLSEIHFFFFFFFPPFVMHHLFGILSTKLPVISQLSVLFVCGNPFLICCQPISKKFSLFKGRIQWKTPQFFIIIETKTKLEHLNEKTRGEPFSDLGQEKLICGWLSDICFAFFSSTGWSQKN